MAAKNVIASANTMHTLAHEMAGVFVVVLIFSNMVEPGRGNALCWRAKRDSRPSFLTRFFNQLVKRDLCSTAFRLTSYAEGQNIYC